MHGLIAHNHHQQFLISHHHPSLHARTGRCERPPTSPSSSSRRNRCKAIARGARVRHQPTYGRACRALIQKKKVRGWAKIIELGRTELAGSRHARTTCTASDEKRGHVGRCRAANDCAPSMRRAGHRGRLFLIRFAGADGDFGATGHPSAYPQGRHPDGRALPQDLGEVPRPDSPVRDIIATDRHIARSPCICKCLVHSRP
jgi:hypothetical protein